MDDGLNAVLANDMYSSTVSSAVIRLRPAQRAHMPAARRPADQNNPMGAP